MFSLYIKVYNLRHYISLNKIPARKEKSLLWKWFRRKNNERVNNIIQVNLTRIQPCGSHVCYRFEKKVSTPWILKYLRSESNEEYQKI